MHSSRRYITYLMNCLLLFYTIAYQKAVENMRLGIRALIIGWHKFTEGCYSPRGLDGSFIKKEVSA